MDVGKNAVLRMLACEGKGDGCMRGMMAMQRGMEWLMLGRRMRR